MTIRVLQKVVKKKENGNEFGVPFCADRHEIFDKDKTKRYHTHTRMNSTHSQSILMRTTTPTFPDRDG